MLIELRGIGEIGGRIAWATDGRIGVAFDQQIDPMRARKPVASKTAIVVDAALTRSARAAPARQSRGESDGGHLFLDLQFLLFQVRDHCRVGMRAMFLVRDAALERRVLGLQCVVDVRFDMDVILLRWWNLNDE